MVLQSRANVQSWLTLAAMTSRRIPAVSAAAALARNSAVQPGSA
jgi:hypothetical protein